MRKAFLTPLIAATMSFAGYGCGSEKPKPENPNELKLGDVTYTIIDDNRVGVTEEHNKDAAYLFNGDHTKEVGDRRRAVYYMREGAVIAELHADATSPSSTDLQPRPIKQMLDFELDEFKKAKQFFTARLGKKQDTALPKAATPLDTLKKGAQ